MHQMSILILHKFLRENPRNPSFPWYELFSSVSNCFPLGCIQQGDTFENSSYQGNDGLHGFSCKNLFKNWNAHLLQLSGFNSPIIFMASKFSKRLVGKSQLNPLDERSMIRIRAKMLLGLESFMGP